MSLPKVFISRPLPAIAVQRIAQSCEVSMNPKDVRLPPQELAAACRDVEGLMTSATPVSAELVAQAPHLRVISAVAVGYDNIDVEACTRRGIMVTNTPGVVTEATADLSFGLLMAVARRLVEADRYVREGHWSQWALGCMWGTDLARQDAGHLRLWTHRPGRGTPRPRIQHAHHLSFRRPPHPGAGTGTGRAIRGPRHASARSRFPEHPRSACRPIPIT